MAEKSIYVFSAQRQSAARVLYTDCIGCPQLLLSPSRRIGQGRLLSNPHTINITTTTTDLPPGKQARLLTAMQSEII
jgi:hypothetical protein